MNSIELAEVLNNGCALHSKMLADGEATATGVYLYFESADNGNLALGGNTYRNMENIKQNIHVLNIRTFTTQGVERVSAMVYMPIANKDFFLKKFKAYETEYTKGGERRFKHFVESVATLRIATAQDFLGSETTLVDGKHGYEVWLRDGVTNLKELCNNLGIDCKDRELKLRGRQVNVIKADVRELNRLILHCEYLAEFRLATYTVHTNNIKL